MQTEIKIRTTQACPTCKGEGEIYNPEWQAFSDALAAWEKEYPKHTTAERVSFENDYWESKGYERQYFGYGSQNPGTHYVNGPWDFRRCEDCEGSKVEVRERHVSLAELAAMLVGEGK